jgi:hypothetical protein
VLLFTDKEGTSLPLKYAAFKNKKAIAFAQTRVDMSKPLADIASYYEVSIKRSLLRSFLITIRR